MITVYYDGKCGLCRREINHYKRVAPSGVFNWQDITVNPSVVQEIGISYADGLKLLHARDKHGRVHVGVDAFLLIWRHINRWHMLAKLVDSPLIRPLANSAYRIFAMWRFKRLSHCQIALENVNLHHK